MCSQLSITASTMNRISPQLCLVAVLHGIRLSLLGKTSKFIRLRKGFLSISCAVHSVLAPWAGQA
ncbi:hypothetical protein JOD24_002135 [Kroppenstedtia sanguinis]